MVQLETKLALALTIRDFDIEPVYAEDAPTFFGEHGYQVTLPDSTPTSRIKDDLPIKVRRRFP